MISTGHIIVVLVVVLLLFGTKRLRNAGSDLGAAIKGFKKSMSDGEQEAQKKPELDQQGRVIDNDATAQRDRQDNNKKS